MRRLAALIAVVAFTLAATAGGRPTESVRGLHAWPLADGRIAVVALDGSMRTFGTRVPGRRVWEVAFSPRGDRIAAAFFDAGAGPTSIYVASIDAAGEDALVIRLPARAGDLRWSRDGSRVAAVVRPSVLDCVTRTGEAAVIVVDTSTGTVTRLPVALPRRLKPSRAGPVAIRNWGFSPDGNHVLLEADGYIRDRCGDSLGIDEVAFMTVRTDGAGQRGIHALRVSSPASSAVWDPTGTFVAAVDIICYFQAPCEFDVVRVASGGRRTVTSRRSLDELVWIGGGRGLVAIDRDWSENPDLSRARVSLLALNGRTRSLALLPRGDAIELVTTSDDRRLLAYVVISDRGNRVEILDLASGARRSFQVSKMGHALGADLWVGTDS